MKSKNLVLVFLLTASFHIVLAQTKTATVDCGNKIQQEFSSSIDKHLIKIKLDAGDKLSIKVIPTGDYLNIRAEIRDPADGLIYPADIYRNVEPMFTLGMRSLEVTTGVLSATGIYNLYLYNNYKIYKHDARAGQYTLIVNCIKRDGTVISVN